MILGLGAVALAAILRSLSQQLRLQREDVVQHPIDTPAFEAMVGDHAGAVEVAPQRDAEWSVDARATSHLGLLQQLQAPIPRLLAQPVRVDRQVPATSTRPSAADRPLPSFRGC